MAEGEVGGEDGGTEGRFERVGDGAGDAGVEGHREEGGVEGGTIGQAKGDIAGADGDVEAPFIHDLGDGGEGDGAGLAIRADCHDEWVDDDIFLRDAHLEGALDDLIRDDQTLLSGGRDAVVVHAEGNDGGSVLFGQREDGCEGGFLSVDGIDEGFALIDLQGGREGGRVGGVDAEGYIGDGHDLFDHAREEGDLIHAGHAGVDIQNLRAGPDLGKGVTADGLEVARLKGIEDLFAAGGVDAFADDDGGRAAGDGDGFGFGGEGGGDGCGHVVCLILYA